MVAPGVAVLHFAFQKIGHGLETAMRVGRESASFAGRQGRRPQVVQQQKWVQVHEVRPREGPAECDAVAIVGWGGGENLGY
jgi:hypothetical protein